MSSSIFKCNKCNLHTLKENCPKCNKKTNTVKPPKFSIQDKYADYRRKAKRPELEKNGLL